MRISSIKRGQPPARGADPFCRLVDAEHDVHVLDCRAGGAFAEVVEEGSDAGLALMAADHDLQMVSAGQFIGIECSAVCAERHDAHEVRARVVFLKSFADVLRGGSAGQHTVVQHNGGRHSLVVIVDYGQENGRCLEAADFDHFRDVFVLERQAVDAGRVEGLCLVGRLIIRDHLLAAAGITGQGEAGERVENRHNSHSDQRCSAGDAGQRTAPGNRKSSRQQCGVLWKRQ